MSKQCTNKYNNKRINWTLDPKSYEASTFCKYVLCHSHYNIDVDVATYIYDDSRKWAVLILPLFIPSI